MQKETEDFWAKDKTSCLRLAWPVRHIAEDLLTVSGMAPRRGQRNLNSGSELGGRVTWR